MEGFEPSDHHAEQSTQLPQESGDPTAMPPVGSSALTAKGTGLSPAERDLQDAIDLLPKLSEPLRSSIVALIKASASNRAG